MKWLGTIWNCSGNFLFTEYGILSYYLKPAICFCSVGCRIWWHSETTMQNYNKCLLLLEWISQTSREAERFWWIPAKTPFIVASLSVLPSSRPVIAIRRDARQISCSSGLAGASGGKASLPSKLLQWLAGLMSTGILWRSQLLVLAASKLSVTVFSQCKRSGDWC
jgi:hypothetical protein